jgi:cell division protein ZapA (FtsZ GTPase activity inhibitor)
VSAEEKTRITVDIFGTHYKLVGKSSVSYMKMVAAHVNDQMYHIANAFPQLDSSKIAVLASVNMADEFFKLRKELEALQGNQLRSVELEEKYQKLMQQNAELEHENKAWQEKQNQSVEHSNQLQLEIIGFQAELQAALQQHQAQQELLQSAEHKIFEMQNEQVRQREAQVEVQQQIAASESAVQQSLQEENATLRQELERERARWSNQESDDQELAQDYKNLTVEYEKLKKEYNEWIQLVMEKDDPS